MVTKAKIDLQGKRAILTESGKRLQAKILQPGRGSFEIDSAQPPTDREKSNKGMSILAVKLKT